MDNVSALIEFNTSSAIATILLANEQDQPVAKTSAYRELPSANPSAQK